MKFERIWNGGREMRRRKPGLTLQFSLEASIRATAMTAGFFTPIYTARKEQQEFLVLVERTGRGDQQEQYYRALVDALKPFSFIELYTFQGSPANVRDHVAEGWIGLRELAARYPTHKLWIIGDTTDFIDPLTLAIPEWMREMQLWPSSSMLSPHALIEASTALSQVRDRSGDPLCALALHPSDEDLSPGTPVLARSYALPR